MKSRPAESFPFPATKVHPHAWLWEPLADEPSFVLRSMFGAKAVYLDGKLMLAFCTGDEPWRGVLVCTTHEHHAALIQEFPELAPHPILPKWLYLPETAGRFERTATDLVRRARERSPLLGVLPQPRQQKSARPSTARQIKNRRRR